LLRTYTRFISSPSPLRSKRKRRKPVGTGAVRRRALPGDPLPPRPTACSLPAITTAGPSDGRGRVPSRRPASPLMLPDQGGCSLAVLPYPSRAIGRQSTSWRHPNPGRLPPLSTACRAVQPTPAGLIERFRIPTRPRPANPTPGFRKTSAATVRCPLLRLACGVSATVAKPSSAACQNGGPGGSRTRVRYACPSASTHMSCRSRDGRRTPRHLPGLPAMTMCRPASHRRNPWTGAAILSVVLGMGRTVPSPRSRAASKRQAWLGAGY